MRGCRSLSDSEIKSLSMHLSTRDRTILILGVRAGFRIQELLSLNVGDVLGPNGSMLDTVKVQRSNTKGKTEGQAVPMHAEAKAVLSEYLATRPGAKPDEPLFLSAGTGGKFPGRLEQSVFRKALKKASSRASIRDQHLVSTHSLRKSYAARMYRALGENIFKLQRAMRHASITSTTNYLGVDDEEIFDAIKNVK